MSGTEPDLLAAERAFGAWQARHEVPGMSGAHAKRAWLEAYKRGHTAGQHALLDTAGSADGG